MLYILVGYEVIVKKAGSDEWKDMFIPDADISNPKTFVLTLFH